jgi:hypothetical protein
MGHGRLVGWHSSTYVLVLAAGILLTPLSDAAPARPVAGQPATVSLSQAWAFDGQQIVNQSTTQGSWTVAEAGSFQWAVLLSERSSGPWGVELQIDRGMVSQFRFLLCTPSCAEPTYELSSSLVATEWAVEFLNLTTRASVQVGSQPSDGVGVENLSVVAQSNLSTVSSVGGATTLASTESNSSSVSSDFTVGFASPFGLFPTAPGPLASWSSRSVGIATGGWELRYDSTVTGSSAPSSQGSHQEELPATIPLALAGAVTGPVGLAAGPTTDGLAMHPNATFRLLDGLVFSPLAASQFPASPGATVQEGLSENGSVLDYDPTNTAHLGLLASESWFQPSIAPPAGAATAPAGDPLASFEPPAWPVQAEAESPSAALAEFQNEHFLAPTLAPTSVNLQPGAGFAWGSPWPYFAGLAGVVGIVVALGVRRRGNGRHASELDVSGTGAETPARDSTSEPPTHPQDGGSVRDPFDDLI